MTDLPLPSFPLAEPGEEKPLVFAAPKRGKPPRHWSEMLPEERVAVVKGLGLPTFRASQLSNHWFTRTEFDPSDWTDLSKADRELVRPLFPELLTEIQTLTTDDEATVKTAWRLHDGSVLETVLMHYPGRNTICISSQAGCGMACPFCATGQGGLQRNLSAGEIIAQVSDAMGRLARGEFSAPGRVNNIVFMGMGEPMANYQAVMEAVRTLIRPQPDGLGISARGITISTVGLVPRIKQLTQEGLPVTLAVSLHAPDNELRHELIPVNTRWDVEELLDAAWEYAKVSKRRVSIEYALIRDMNDQPQRADLLAKKLKSRGDWNWAHVNLIPLNPTPGSKWTASRKPDEREFLRRLIAHGVPATMRDTRGRDIDGACGQLAAKVER